MKKKSKSYVPKGRIINTLRKVHMYCPEKKAAKQRSKIDSALFKCENPLCSTALYEGKSEKNLTALQEKYPDYNLIQGKIELDHVKSVVKPSKGFSTWDDYIEGLWVHRDGYLCLCRECHAAKTEIETNERVKHGSLKRKK